MGLWLQSLGPDRKTSLDAPEKLTALLLHCTTIGSIPGCARPVAYYFCASDAAAMKTGLAGYFRKGPLHPVLVPGEFAEWRVLTC